MNNHFKRNWRNYLTIIFFLLFVAFLYYFYLNVETLKYNPCELCVEHYGFTCTDGRGLVLYKGYDWDGSERKKDIYNEMNKEVIEGLEYSNNWLKNYTIQK